MIFKILFLTTLALGATHYKKNIEVSASKSGAEKKLDVLVEYKDGYGWNSYLNGDAAGFSKQEQEMAMEYAVKVAKEKYEQVQVTPKLEILNAKETEKSVD